MCVVYCVKCVCVSSVCIWNVRYMSVRNVCVWVCLECGVCVSGMCVVCMGVCSVLCEWGVWCMGVSGVCMECGACV